jgi:ferredoxin
VKADIPYTSRRISRLRWIVQITSFIVLIYGGFIISGIESWLAEPVGVMIENQDSSITTKSIERRSTRTDLYLPTTSCIYQRQGLCKGCSLYYLTDIITWLPSIETVLTYLLILILLMLIAGRLWCGWICPLGLISDLLTKIRQSLGIARVRISKKWWEGLIWTKYILLFLSLLIAALAAFPPLADVRLSLSEPFCRVCPSRIFAAFFSFDEICWVNDRNTITGIFTAFGLLAFMLFFIGLSVRRFWCRLCPIGGMNAPCNRTGLVMLVKDSQKCTRCGACARSCPLDIQKVKDGREYKDVTAYECHLCLRCVEACPEKGCLEFKWLGKRITGS